MVRPRMRGPRQFRSYRGGFLTIEMILSIGLAAAALTGFLSFYHSVRLQQLQLKHFASATLTLQSKMEEVRLGRYGTALEKLTWAQSEENGTNIWTTASQSAGGPFSWHLLAETKPVAGELFALKTVVTWNEPARKKEERVRAERISAATKLNLK